MQKVTGSLVALEGGESAPALVEAVNEQAALNEIIAEQAGHALLPIFNVLHNAPTPRMLIDVSRVLIDHGFTLWATFVAAAESARPQEGAIAADALKHATRLSSAYGSPIIGGLTHQLDLRPTVPAGGPRPPSLSADTPPNDAWREEAKAVLPLISMELTQRGFKVTPTDSPWRLRARWAADEALLVEVCVSVIETEPFTLEIWRDFPPDRTQHYVRAHPTTQVNLGRTINAFLAGREDRAARPPEAEEARERPPRRTLQDFRDAITARHHTLSTRIMPPDEESDGPRLVISDPAASALLFRVYTEDPEFAIEGRLPSGRRFTFWEGSLEHTVDLILAMLTAYKIPR